MGHKKDSTASESAQPKTGVTFFGAGRTFNLLKRMKTPQWVLLLLLFETAVRACIWDSDTLSQEKKKSPKMAEVILGNAPGPENPQRLRDKIKELESNTHENDSAWWNDLAGAHLRLGEAKEAAGLLEKVAERFPNDYGIHANLGTAYHLLGRYKEAEKEIARDLEINPDAHFGLEKYHLALLQYLMRDAKYQSRHVYVDEFTTSLFQKSSGRFPRPSEEFFSKIAQEDFTNGLTEADKFYEEFAKTKHSDDETINLLGELAALDVQPAYRAKWNLADDSKLEAGVAYIGELNPKQPACFVALGIVAWRKHELHLARTSFQKAIELNSPQSEILWSKVTEINSYLSHANFVEPWFPIALIALIPVAVCYYFYAKRRHKRRNLMANQ
jgi:Tetratricopeptide repeat